MRPHLDQRLRILGTISLYHDCHMGSPLDSGEIHAAYRDLDDAALQEHGYDPARLTQTERIIALDDITYQTQRGISA